MQKPLKVAAGCAYCIGIPLLLDAVAGPLSWRMIAAVAFVGVGIGHWIGSKTEKAELVRLASEEPSP